MTTTPTTDGDELDDDLTYDGRNDEGCCATLKYACEDGCEDLLSAIYTLISVVRMLQSRWTCTGFGQYCLNVIIIEVLVVISTDICDSR